MATQTLPQRRSARPWLLIGIVVIVIAIIAAVALTAVRPAGTVVQAETVRVSRGALVATIESSGSVAAAQSLDLAFQTSGVVAEVLVQQGDVVRAGQPLARLDDRDLRLSVSSAEAGLASAQARLEQSLDGNATPQQIAGAEASLRSAQANLDQTRSGNTTAADIAGAEAALRSAQAQLDELLAGPTSDTVMSAQVRVDTARTALQSQRDSLSAAKTRAESQVQQQANALRAAQEEYSTIYWENRELDRFPGDLPQERIDQEASALRAVQDAEENLRQAQVSFEEAQRAEVTGLQSAEADLRDAEEQLRVLQQGPTSFEITRAEASVDQARAELQRLRQGGSAAEVAAAQAGVDQAAASLAQLTEPDTITDRAVQEANVAQAQQTLEQAQLRLEQAVLTAPFDGVIASVAIVPGSSASSATAAFTLINRDPLHVDLRLNEADVARLELGQPVELTIDALPDWRAEGTVTYIAPSAETINNVVTFRVQVDFADTDERVKVGMSANVNIVTDRNENALLVPNAALLPRGAEQIVQAPDGAGGIREIAVVTGLSDGLQTEILSGLTEGDLILATPNSAPQRPAGPFGQ